MFEMNLEILHELILVLAGFVFIFGGIQLACEKYTLGCLFLGYGSIPFAVDCMVNKLYIYFLIWTVVCYGAFFMLYKNTEADREAFYQDVDNILNDD